MGSRIKKKKDFKTKWGCVVQILILLMCILSFYLSSKVFVIPSFGNISSEQYEISEIDKKLYDILSKVDKVGRAWYLSIEQKEEVLKLRSEENERLYNSIGPTEVVQKGFSGNMRPVGKYADYLDEIEAIGKEWPLLEYEKRKVAAERGGLVNDVEVKSLWKQRLSLMKEINEYQMRKTRYLSSEKGSRISFYKDFFFIFGLISVLVSVFWGAYRISS